MFQSYTINVKFLYKKKKNEKGVFFCIFFHEKKCKYAINPILYRKLSIKAVTLEHWNNQKAYKIRINKI